MKLRLFNWLGLALLAAASALTTSAQSLSFTTSTFNHYAVNGSGEDPTIHITGGVSYTLTVNVGAGQPLFLTAAAPPSSSSPNYYTVNPGAFSSAAMSSPVTSASLTFTPPASGSSYNLYYVDSMAPGYYGILTVDVAVVTPDTTSTILISRPIVPTNGPATVTVVPRVNGNIVNANSSIYSMSVSAGGGSVSGLSPASGTNFTASYTAGTSNATFSVFDGYGASVPVSVVKSVPFSNFSVTNLSSTQRLWTARSFSNCTFQILMSTNLNSWFNLGSATSATNGVLQFTDTNTLSPIKHFYRLAFP